MSRTQREIFNGHRGLAMLQNVHACIQPLLDGLAPHAGIDGQPWTPTKPC